MLPCCAVLAAQRSATCGKPTTVPRTVSHPSQCAHSHAFFPTAQPFPFEGCPPTKAEPGHSPGLHRLTQAIQAKLPGMSTAERNSVIKVGGRSGKLSCPLHVPQSCCAWRAGRRLLRSRILFPSSQASSMPTTTRLLRCPPPPAAGDQHHLRIQLVPALDGGAGHRAPAAGAAGGGGPAAHSGGLQVTFGACASLPPSS